MPVVAGTISIFASNRLTKTSVDPERSRQGMGRLSRLRHTPENHRRETRMARRTSDNGHAPDSAQTSRRLRHFLIPPPKMNMSTSSLIDGICHKGVLLSVSIRYWRGCKRLKPEDLGLDPSKVSKRLIALGQKRLIAKEALSEFALIESRTHAMVEGASFPFLGGIARFVPNPRLADITNRLELLRGEFVEDLERFVGGYSLLRDKALAEWRDTAYQMGGNPEHLIATIEQSFPPVGSIAKRFAFETQLFQIAAPEGLRLELTNGIEEFEAFQSRQRIAEQATLRLQSDLDGFIRESVISLRQETAKLANEILATIDESKNGVHQRTLNRLATFIDGFRTLNFADDRQLENTLDSFRRELLNRSAEDYRNNAGAMSSLTDGLNRLRENAVRLVRGDATELVSRFGQVGQRRLAAV